MSRKKSSEAPDDPEVVLYNNRIISIDKEVTEETCTTWMNQIIALDFQDQTKPIIILINSVGGHVYSALALIDIIERTKSPVYTVCTGLAASCAALILSCGKKRFATPSSAVMIHQIWTSFDEIRVKDLAHEMKELNRVQELIMNKFLQRTKMDRNKLDEVHAKDSYFGSNEALELGIIDEIGWDIHEWTRNVG